MKTLLGSKLVRKQICLYGIFPARQLNAIVTPFVNAISTLGQSPNQASTPVPLGIS